MSDESGTRILAFAGAKQSGKTTSCNFLHGYQLRAQEVVQNFGIEPESGKLVINTEILGEDGKKEQGDTFLDVSRRDSEFVEWAMYNMWPFVKKYSFADSLKSICMSLFGFTYEQCYGSNAYKDQIIPHLLWENMPGVMTPTEWSMRQGGVIAGYNQNPQDFGIQLNEGPMTAREFMQYFGTDVMRKIWEPIWIKRTLKDIEEERPLLAIIDDCRFKNEILAIQEVGGKVIGQTRSPHADNHSSEKEIKDNLDILDKVIDNQDMEIHDVCKEVINILGDWGWLGATTVTNGKRTLHTIKGN
jgi:hypothetical protein